MDLIAQKIDKLIDSLGIEDPERVLTILKGYTSRLEREIISGISHYHFSQYIISDTTGAISRASLPFYVQIVDQKAIPYNGEQPKWVSLLGYKECINYEDCDITVYNTENGTDTNSIVVGIIYISVYFRKPVAVNGNKYMIIDHNGKIETWYVKNSAIRTETDELIGFIGGWNYYTNGVFVSQL
jgi:hypothetical protein